MLQRVRRTSGAACTVIRDLKATPSPSLQCTLWPVSICSICRFTVLSDTRHSVCEPDELHAHKLGRSHVPIPHNRTCGPFGYPNCLRSSTTKSEKQPRLSSLNKCVQSNLGAPQRTPKCALLRSLQRLSNETPACCFLRSTKRGIERSSRCKCPTV